MMKAVVRLAHRQAEEGDDHQHVAAKLVGYLEREIEDRARDDVDADRNEHHDQRQHACEIAEPLDRTFRQGAHATSIARAAALCTGRQAVWGRRQWPTAARTLPSASTTSGPRDFAHSSQYGFMASTARAVSSGRAEVKV